MGQVLCQLGLWSKGRDVCLTLIHAINNDGNVLAGCALDLSR